MKLNMMSQNDHQNVVAHLFEGFPPGTFNFAVELAAFPYNNQNTKKKVFLCLVTDVELFHVCHIYVLPSATSSCHTSLFSTETGSSIQFCHYNILNIEEEVDIKIQCLKAIPTANCPYFNGAEAYAEVDVLFVSKKTTC